MQDRGKPETARYHVTSMGNAIVDVLWQAPESAIADYSLNRGSMTLIDEDRAEFLTSVMGEDRLMESGGSAGNTAVGIAALGGRSAYVGKVKDDDLGRAFRSSLTETGTLYETPFSTEGPATARCLIFVTPDGQRTMNTFLGASTRLAPQDIDAAVIGASAVTYMEGYLWDQPEAKEARPVDPPRHAGRVERRRAVHGREDDDRAAKARGGERRVEGRRAARVAVHPLGDADDPPRRALARDVRDLAEERRVAEEEQREEVAQRRAHRARKVAELGGEDEDGGAADEGGRRGGGQREEHQRRRLLVARRERALQEAERRRRLQHVRHRVQEASVVQQQEREGEADADAARRRLGGLVRAREEADEARRRAGAVVGAEDHPPLGRADALRRAEEVVGVVGRRARAR